jgi:hypothetical protein
MVLGVIPTVPEPKAWTEVAALFESLRTDFRILAENMADIQPRIVRIESTVNAHTEDLKLLTAPVKTLARNVQDVKDRLTAVETRS